MANLFLIKKLAKKLWRLHDTVNFLMRTGPRDYSVRIERRLQCTVLAWIQWLEVIINIKQFGKTHRAMMNCCASVKLETLMTPMPWQLRGGVEIMKDRLHDTRGIKSRDYLETIGHKNFGELKGIRQSFLLYGINKRSGYLSVTGRVLLQAIRPARH